MPSASPPPGRERYLQQPLFLAAVAYSCGVLAAQAWRPPALWLLAALLLVAAAFFFLQRRPEIALATALGALAAAGGLGAELEAGNPAPVPDVRAIAYQDAIVSGHILRSNLARSSGGIVRQVVDVETESVTIGDTSPALRFGLRVSVYAPDSDSAPDLRYGQRLRFPATLREPRNYGNPGAMDYRGYLRGNGIVALAAVKSANIESLPGFEGTRLGAWRSRLRRSLVEHMLALESLTRSAPRIFRLGGDDVGLLAAMLIGEQSLLDRDVKAEFQRTGVFHILVVSGMNVGIVAFIVFWVARWMRAGPIAGTVATIALSFLYAYMTDLGAPIVRAAWMLSIYLASRLLYRDRFSLNSIGAAALAMLAFSPAALFDPSFQLTFLSVVALGGIAQPLLERTSEPYRQSLQLLDNTGLDVALAPAQAQLRLDLRLVAGRLGSLFNLNFAFLRRWLREGWSTRMALRLLHFAAWCGIALYDLVVVTGIMQVALALPMVMNFHRLALLGLPANMAVVPLTFLLMPLGIAAALLSYLSSSLALLPAWMTAATLHGIRFTVERLGGVRFADWRVASPGMLASALAIAAFVFAMFAVRRRSYLSLAAVAALVLSAVALMVPRQAETRAGVLEVTAIDVGQGDSILVISPDGRTLLVDAGGPLGFAANENSFDVGENVVSPYLWARGVSRLDAVALTHDHSDHLGGLASVISNFRPRELWIGADSPSPAFQALLKRAAAGGTVVVRRRAGDEISFGAARIAVLAPDPTHPAAHKNNDSLALQIFFGSTSALLTGDAEREEERMIAAQVDGADLLKVAHHGSASSTTPELLAAAHPSYAVISAGYHNLYGHPRGAVLARLTGARVKNFRTDVNGASGFYLDGQRIVPAR